MIARLFDIFFGCWHRKYSFPITRWVEHGPWRNKQTYVVCLECGAEFAYDWKTMRAGKRILRPALKPDFVTEARRADDDLRAVGRLRLDGQSQQPLQKTVLTIERKKA